MQELIFKNYLKSVFLLVTGIIIASMASILGSFNIAVPQVFTLVLTPVDIPLPLLILGTLAAFLGCCFIFYPKATMGQTLQIAITGVLFNAIIITGSYLLSGYLNAPQITVKPEFIMNFSLLIPGAGFIFSLLTLFSGVKLQKIEDIEPEQTPEQAPVEQTEPETPAGESFESHTPQEIHKIAPKQEETGDKETLEPLEPLELNDSPEVKSENDFIPTDIRLVQTSHSKETEQKGRIGAIGKLLVNNKNIEGLIESEELLNSKTNVITTVSGQKIYGKLDDLKREFSCIREMALVDSGGFILANNFEDKQRVQIAGALVAGAYHTIQNYLTQLSLDFPVRIFFETENANSFIIKTRDEVLFSIWNKEFQQVEYGPMAEILEEKDFSGIDIIPYADLIKVENFAVSDSEGALVNSFGDAESSKVFAAVSSAVFENLKVFLMNISLLNLSKIAVFTPQKTITIIKPRDKIVAFLTDSEDYPKVSEELLAMEEI